MRSPATARSSSPRTTPPTSMPSCWARGSSRRSVGASSGSARRSSSRGRSWGISRVTAACTRSTARGRTSRRTGWPSGSSTRATCCSCSPKAHAAPTERCRKAGTGSRRSRCGPEPRSFPSGSPAPTACGRAASGCHTQAAASPCASVPRSASPTCSRPTSRKAMPRPRPRTSSCAASPRCFPDRQRGIYRV